MGLLSSVLGGIGGAVGLSGGAEKQEAQSRSEQITPRAMKRPDEYGEIFQTFLNSYLGTDPNLRSKSAELQKQLDFEKQLLTRTGGNTAERQKKIQQIARNKAQLDQQLTQGAGRNYGDILNQAYDEKRDATQDYLGNLEQLISPYANAQEREGGQHSGLLSDIISKRMVGGDVGPYSKAIDDLLGERTRVSFGQGSPMEFITGSQKDLLSNLLSAQETGLGNIAGMSRERYDTGMRPDQSRYDMGREIADKREQSFIPSEQGKMEFLQELKNMFEPMEQLRMYGGSGTGLGTSTGDSMGRSWNASAAAKVGGG